MPDFLGEPPVRSDPPEGPVITDPFVDMLQLLRDVRRELRKQSPGILTTPVVQPSNQIIDLAQHVIKFRVAGQDIPIYKLIVHNNYNQDIYVYPKPLYVTGANPGGIKVAKSGGYLEINNVEIWELYFSAAVLSNNLLVVNNVNPAQLADGFLGVLGWTTDEWAIAYQPDRR